MRYKPETLERMQQAYVDLQQKAPARRAELAKRLRERAAKDSEGQRGIWAEMAAEMEER